MERRRSVCSLGNNILVSLLFATIAEVYYSFCDAYPLPIMLFALDIDSRPGSELDPRAARMLEFENETPKAPLLTIFLLIAFFLLILYARDSLTTKNIQNTIIAARTMRPRGAAATQKRSV
jgi:hypothetical protein